MASKVGKASLAFHSKCPDFSVDVRVGPFMDCFQGVSMLQSYPDHIPILVRGRHKLQSLVWKTTGSLCTRSSALEIAVRGGHMYTQ